MSLAQSSKTVDKTCAYFLFFAITNMAVKNIGAVNGVDENVTTRNVFNQIRNGAQEVASQPNTK